MISVRECFMRRLGDEEMLQAFFSKLISEHGIENKYFMTELSKGSSKISEDEVKAYEEDMELPIFARIPYTHIGYMFDLENAFEINGEYYVEGPVIFGMHYGDIFYGLEEEDFTMVNKAISYRRCTLQYEEGPVEVFKIVKGDLGL